VSAQFAAREAEARVAEYWRKVHWGLLPRVRAVDRQPTDDMLVVCCSFEVLHVVPMLETQ
jgi:uncharacterized protein YhfF